MATVNKTKGRGRPRQLNPPPPPGASSSLDLGASSQVLQNTQIINNSDMDNSSTISRPIRATGRGRGIHREKQHEVPDPRWKVSELTVAQFQSTVQPSRPQEYNVGGQQIMVKLNYFPIRKIPEKGTVVQYDIDITNKIGRQLPSRRLRGLYEVWLSQFCQKYPELNPHKIVYDNQHTIFTFDQLLPNIDEHGIIDKIMAMTQFYRVQEHEIHIKRVGSPFEFSSLAFLNNARPEEHISSVDNNNLLRAQQIIATVLRESCSKNSHFVYKRTIFPPLGGVDKHGEWDLGLGTALWRGFYSCLVPTRAEHQLLINLDISYGTFRKRQPFIEFLRELMLQSPCGRKYIKRFGSNSKAKIEDVIRWLDDESDANDYQTEIQFLESHCKNLLVRSQVANKIIGYRITGIGAPASKQKFEWNKNGEKRTVTVKEYYYMQYKLNLTYPTLPTLIMSKNAFVPMEIIDVEPMRVIRITEEQRALLCTKSTLPPPEYFRRVQDIREDPRQQCYETDPFVQAWNLGIDVEMVRVLAHVTPSPTISYGNRVHVRPDQSTPSSTWNDEKVIFKDPKNFPPVWALINLSTSLDMQRCEQLYQELMHLAFKKGMNCPEPEIYEEYRVENSSVHSLMMQMKSIVEHYNDCEFYMVILPENLAIINEVYCNLKKLFELESGFGVISQMIKLKPNEGTSPWNRSRLNNILQKINTKLKGVNFILHVDDKIEHFFSQGHRCMYVGIDLSHVTTGPMVYSTVAVVASADDIPSRYFKEVSLQIRPSERCEHSIEYVTHLKEMMMSLISQYEQYRGYPPRTIVIYRDGISDSEFSSVFEKELTAIRRACVELSPAYRPYLTYIVVTKRHHTRMKPVNSNGNVPPGTATMDPATYSLYMVSHHSQKGTARPTCYHVLHDDNKLTPEQIRMLTHALCFASARSTRSISIPAPVKYADLLAFRASCYINRDDPWNSESTVEESIVSVGQDDQPEGHVRSKRIVLNSRLEKDCVFFI